MSRAVRVHLDSGEVTTAVTAGASATTLAAVASACATPCGLSGTSPRPEYRPSRFMPVSPCRTRISRVDGAVGGAQDGRAAPPAGAGSRRPAAASIASLASRSAWPFSARGIHSKATASNRRISAAASAASGRSPGFLICQRPHICSTTSLESIRTSTSTAPSSAAARSPAIRPEYSATLLVATPSPSARSASTSPVFASRTTAP
jgi:hypothetical protein